MKLIITKLKKCGIQKFYSSIGDKRTVLAPPTCVKILIVSSLLIFSKTPLFSPSLSILMEKFLDVKFLILLEPDKEFEDIKFV